MEVSLPSEAVLNLLDTTHLRVTMQQKVEVSMHLTVLSTFLEKTFSSQILLAIMAEDLQ